MRRHILHRTVSVFLLICLLLSFTACTKLRAKRLEFTPYYSEHIASAYEQTPPTLLMSEPVPKDFDKDASVLVPYFHYAVYKPSTGFAAVDQAAEAYINAQLDTTEAMYRQDAALNMDYSLNVLDNKLGQLYIYGFSCTLADQQPQGDMLRTALFYNAQDGTLFTMDDILKSETYANFCQMADDLLYSTAQIDISVTSITADTFAAAFQFHTEGLTLHFEAGTFGNEQTDAIDIGIDYEIIVLFSQTNENATVRVWDLVFFDPNNMYNVLDAINKCNREWRYTTFYAEEDNTITVQIDVIFRDGTAGEVTWEATGRLVDIIEGAYTDHLSGIAVK